MNFDFHESKVAGTSMYSLAYSLHIFLETSLVTLYSILYRLIRHNLNTRRSNYCIFSWVLGILPELYAPFLRINLHYLFTFKTESRIEFYLLLKEQFICNNYVSLLTHNYHDVIRLTRIYKTHVHF
mgnify:CR=1 FL=1